MSISQNETTDYAYYIERDGNDVKINFLQYDTDDGKWVTIEVARKYKVRCSKKVDDFTDDLTETSSLPEEYHEALAYYVIQQEYQADSKERPMDMNKASYFGAGFNKMIKMMKTDASERNIKTAYIKPHTY